MLRSAARAAGVVPKGIAKAPPSEYWNAIMEFVRTPENKKIVAAAQAAAMQTQRKREEVEAAFPIVSPGGRGCGGGGWVGGEASAARGRWMGAKGGEATPRREAECCERPNPNCAEAARRERRSARAARARE